MTSSKVNDLYNQALSNKKNRLIMKKACGRFVKQIPHDELVSIRLHALWAAILCFDETKGRSFSSYLYARTDFLCRSWVYKKKNSVLYVDLDSALQYSKEYDFEFYDILDTLPDDIKDIIMLRYIHDMPITKIAKLKRLCPKTIVRKISSGLLKLKNIYKNII